MAHFAKVVGDTVTQIIVAEPDFFDSFVDSSPGKWIQTSYNTTSGVHYDPETNEPSDDQSKAFRKNFAGIGFTYDEARDAFIPPREYPSWVLNEDSCLWEPPIAYPEVDSDEQYDWNEETTSWQLIE
jgi:hypothetical protein